MLTSNSTIHKNFFYTGAQTGKIIIANQFWSGGGIETIEFDDTSTIDLTALNYTINGTAGDAENNVAVLYVAANDDIAREGIDLVLCERDNILICT